MIRGLAAFALAASGLSAAAQDDILARHEACVLGGRASGVCAEVLTGHCLDTSSNIRELTRCRAATAAALEDRAATLVAEIGADDPRQRGKAAEILSGSDRIVAEYCAAYGGRMATEESAGHDIRCALMAGHVKVYHLLRLRAGREEEI